LVNVDSFAQLFMQNFIQYFSLACSRDARLGHGGYGCYKDWLQSQRLELVELWALGQVHRDLGETSLGVNVSVSSTAWAMVRAGVPAEISLHK
jgi:hypothetical protein